MGVNGYLFPQRLHLKDLRTARSICIYVRSGDPVRVLRLLHTMNTLDTIEGLFVPFTRVGSGDPVRLLRLLHTTNTLDTL